MSDVQLVPRRARTHRVGLAAAIVALCIAAALVAIVVGSGGSGGHGLSSLTISPLAGTPDASPDTQISFQGVRPAAISRVTVVGDRSGAHRGRLEAYSTGSGASFVLDRPLAQGEHVQVSARVGDQAVHTAFSVARWVTYDFKPFPVTPVSSKGRVQSFVSAPDLRPPVVNVTARSPAATPGDVFTGPNQGAGQWGAMIFDQQGQLVWFDPVPTGQFAMDLRVEDYQGSPHLVWWQGQIFSTGVGYGTDEIYDSHYRPVAQIRAGNGYQADLHETNITPQGTAFITAYTLVRANLSKVGGPADGILQDPVVQEIDIKTGLVMFEWTALGHVPLSDSYTKPGVASQPWDWFHLNSISLGPNGDVLIGSRNTWTAYDVSLRTGDVIWRLGGKRPSFKMGPGTATAYQHDAEWQPDGTITIFDNGGSPTVHPQSRAIRVRVDTASHTVQLAQQLTHTPSLASPSQGNDQALAGGDSFVGWGQQPYFTEFSAAGKTLFDASFPDPGQSYRAYLYTWSATPAAPPAVAVRATGAGRTMVYASWNGATGVGAWRVLAGPDGAHLTSIAHAATSGFETAIPVSTRDPAVAVQALSTSGKVLGTSSPVEVRG